MTQTPFETQITDPKTGRRADIRCIALLRRLPGKRCVFEGLWQAQPVIVKIFTNPWHGRLHFNRERRGLCLLVEHSIPSPKLLHSGKTADGRWALLLEKITPAEDLAQQLEKADDPQQALELCREWFNLVALMHQKGIVQKDLQPGNFLFNGEILYALDPGTICKKRAPLSVRDGLWQLAGMICTMPSFVRQNPHPWLEHYCRQRGWQMSHKMLALLDKFLHKQRQTLVRRTLQKTLRDSKRYFSLQEGPYKGMFTRRDWTPETARQFVRQIDVLMESGQILKRGNTCFVSRVRFGSLDIAIKRYNYKGLWHAVRNTLKGSRARKCWLTAHRLLEYDLPCPAPLAFIEQSSWGLNGQTYFLSVFLDGRTLSAILTDPLLNPEEKESIILETENLLNRLQNAQMIHRDVKLTNFLFYNHQPFLIDLDSIHSYPSKILSKRLGNKMSDRFRAKINNLSSTTGAIKWEQKYLC